MAYRRDCSRFIAPPKPYAPIHRRFTWAIPCTIFLRRLDVPITRGARGSLSVYANQLLRLIHSTLSIDENIRDGAGRSGLHIRQALFVEEAQLWWDDPERSKGAGQGRIKRAGQGGIGNGSSLVLSSVLFHSILERSAPLATDAIKRLRKSPMDLDVYAWLVHRLFHLSKPSMVSWSQLSDQFGHNYGLPANSAVSSWIP
jgi:hypothetical protein